jgi:hypothetical protein
VVGVLELEYVPKRAAFMVSLGDTHPFDKKILEKV